jgi:hypothetical protein
MLELWKPRMCAEAQHMTEESLSRALSVARVLVGRAWHMKETHQDPELFHIYMTLELLSELLDLAYGGLEYWEADTELLAPP